MQSTIYLTIRSHEVVIDYEVSPYSPRCFDHDYEGGEIEHYSATVDGKPFSRLRGLIEDEIRRDVKELQEY